MDCPVHDDWLEAEFAVDTRLRLQVSRRLHCCRSAFQKIEVVDTPRFGRVLLLDDVINVTEQDEAVYHEMLCHVPMQAHADAQRMLVVGGGDGGIIREAVRYPGLRRAVLAEIDAEVIAASRSWLPGVSAGLDDPRVEICTTDASAYVHGHPDTFDIIVIDATDPIGAGQRLYTPEFYRDCRRCLRANGILTAQSESPFFDTELVTHIYTLARKWFPLVRMYTACMPSYVSGVWSFMWCAKSPAQSHLPCRTVPAGLHYYSHEIHRAAFALPPSIKRQFGF